MKFPYRLWYVANNFDMYANLLSDAPAPPLEDAGSRLAYITSPDKRTTVDFFWKRIPCSCLSKYERSEIRDENR